jgi:hypothetical protein
MWQVQHLPGAVRFVYDRLLARCPLEGTFHRLPVHEPEVRAAAPVKAEPCRGSLHRMDLSPANEGAFS